MLKMNKIIILIIIAFIPLVTWGVIKPFRLLFPELNGVYRHHVCVESEEYIDKAEQLYKKSKNELMKKGIELNKIPYFVYCITAECYQSFGGGKERAISFPYLGTIISEESWQGYITQHELVHWYQFQELGAVKTMLVPEWFREGMAYYYSGAPNGGIPKHYFKQIEKFKNQFEGLQIVEVIEHAKNL